jgi:hypothetical protein
MMHCWSLVRPLGLPDVVAPLAIGAIVALALLPFAFGRARPATAFIRGLVLAIIAEFLVQSLVPDGLGPHVALPLFTAVWVFEWRSVAWRVTSPLLLTWAVAVPLASGMGLDNYLSHAISGLIAWFIAGLLPQGRLRLSGTARRAGGQPGAGAVPDAGER